MSSFRKALTVAILAGVAVILVLPPLISRYPSSIASLALGTDDAFSVSGLEPRENQIGGGAIRWMRPKAAFQFEGVGPGLVDLDLEIRDHRTEVTVTANGARVGMVAPGTRNFASRIRLSGPSFLLGFETEGFAAPGRTLGTQLVSIRVTPVSGPDPGWRGLPRRLWFPLGALLIVSVATQALAGLNPWLAWFAPGLFVPMILPAGLWRSGWLFECALLLGVSTLVSALVSSRAQGPPSTRGWLQVALLLALTVHGVVPPSPLINQGDAQLHGNKLAEVAGGNLFPKSRTDHKPPFDFPYGFSFYGVLRPLASDGVSNVAAVRAGSALFSALSAVALALMLGRTSASLAAASLLLWTFAPVHIRTMAFGNLSNLFAQSILVLFLAAAGLMPKGFARAALLTLLVALSATAHLSSLIVLVTLALVAFVIFSDRHSAAFRPLVLGVVVACAYYATFLPMIAAQAPRLLGERGGSAGVFDPSRLPAQILAGAGWPLLGLAALSVLAGAPRSLLPLTRSLAITGVLLAVVALVSPVEVRYLLAVLPVLVVLAAAVFDPGDPRSLPRQSLTSIVDLPWLRTLGSELLSLPLAVGLLLAAIVHGLRILLGFMPLSGV